MSKEQMKKLMQIIEDNGIQVPNGAHLAPDGADLDTWVKLQKPKPQYDADGNLKRQVVPKQTRYNNAVILENDPRYASLCYHDHSSKILLNGEMVNDAMVEQIAIDFEVNYRLKVNDAHLLSAITRVAHQNPIYPIRDWLNTLSWDGTPRLDRLMQDHFGVEWDEDIEPLIQSMSRKMFIGFVARIYDPGCKLDTVPMLLGGKGYGKSTAFEILGGKWFSRADLKIGHKDGLEMIHQSGIWLWELAELKSLQGKSAETSKHFLSTEKDRYRPSYGRLPVERKRRTCFIGTSNNYQILDDGPERRYWIFKLKSKIDLPYLQKNREQIWAEAVQLYKGGEQWWLEPHIDAMLAAYQEAFLVDDPWAFGVAQAITKFGGAATTAQIMEHIDLPMAHQHSGNARRIAQICRDNGYEYVKEDNTRTWRRIKK